MWVESIGCRMEVDYVGGQLCGRSTMWEVNYVGGQLCGRSTMQGLEVNYNICRGGVP